MSALRLQTCGLVLWTGGIEKTMGATRSTVYVGGLKKNRNCNLGFGLLMEYDVETTTISTLNPNP